MCCNSSCATWLKRQFWGNQPCSSAQCLSASYYSKVQSAHEGEYGAFDMKIVVQVAALPRDLSSSLCPDKSIEGGGSKVSDIWPDCQCICCLQVAQMPQLCQLNLLEAMPSLYSSSNHALTAGDLCNDMAAYQVCQHSNAREAPKSNRARVDGSGTGTADDIAAFGRLLVQMYRGKMIHRGADDDK